MKSVIILLAFVAAAHAVPTSWRLLTTGTPAASGATSVATLCGQTLQTTMSSSGVTNIYCNDTLTGTSAGILYAYSAAVSEVNSFQNYVFSIKPVTPISSLQYSITTYYTIDGTTNWLQLTPSSNYQITAADGVASGYIAVSVDPKVLVELNAPTTVNLAFWVQNFNGGATTGQSYNVNFVKIAALQIQDTAGGIGHNGTYGPLYTLTASGAASRSQVVIFSNAFSHTYMLAQVTSVAGAFSTATMRNVGLGFDDPENFPSGGTGTVNTQTCATGFSSSCDLSNAKYYVDVKTVGTQGGDNTAMFSIRVGTFAGAATAVASATTVLASILIAFFAAKH